MAGPSYVLGRFYTAGLPPSGASVRLLCSVTADPAQPACTHSAQSCPKLGSGLDDHNDGHNDNDDIVRIRAMAIFPFEQVRNIVSKRHRNHVILIQFCIYGLKRRQ